MRKRILGIALATSFMLCACGENSGTEVGEKVTKELTLEKQMQEVFEEMKNGKYENLTIQCESVTLPTDGKIQSLSFPVNSISKGRTLKEKLELYKDVIFPTLYDVEEIDTAHIFDLDSRQMEEEVVVDETTGRVELKYEYDSNAILENLESFDTTVAIGYYDMENYQKMESFPEGVCFNLSQGTLGEMLGSASPFSTGDLEVVKSYDCNKDDLSDSYKLLDGEKTVAEAKEEIEAYFDAHYPLIGEDNGIRNKVYSISVKKIPNTDYYMFSAFRTLSYNGIPVREQSDSMLAKEVGVMGEAMLCETGKVDITLGFVNCFGQPTVTKNYEEVVPFGDAMENIAYYLTGDTAFEISCIGVEYRMFTDVVDDVTYYNWTPYWAVRAQNPNDETEISVYVDMETGEVKSY